MTPTWIRNKEAKAGKKHTFLSSVLDLKAITYCISQADTQCVIWIFCSSLITTVGLADLFLMAEPRGSLTHSCLHTHILHLFRGLCGCLLLPSCSDFIAPSLKTIIINNLVRTFQVHISYYCPQKNILKVYYHLYFQTSKPRLKEIKLFSQCHVVESTMNFLTLFFFFFNPRTKAFCISWFHHIFNKF